MKVGVIGSGGREHALCFSLKSCDIIKQNIRRNDFKKS